MDETLTIVHNYTLRQLVVAAGVARGLDKNRVIQLAKCSENTYFKTLKTDGFDDLITAFKAMPMDPDNKVFKGFGTLLIDIARLLYSVGEKTNVMIGDKK